MNLTAARARPKRSAIGTEEERAWVSGAAAVLSGEAVAAPPRQNRHNISVII